MTRGRLVMDTLVRSSSSSDMGGGSKPDGDSSPCQRTPPILRVSAANKSNGSSSRSVSFSSEISVFVPEAEDGSPMSILSGRWVGNISAADAFQEVAVVQVKEKVPCTWNGIRKRLPLVPFEKGSTMSTSGREVPLGGSDSSIYRSPQRQAKESSCDVDEPKPAPISPLSDSSFDLGLLNSGSLGNENEDDRPVSPVSTDSSFDIELYRRRCNMWTRIVDLLRVLLVFGLYVVQVLDTRLCNQHERMFLGIKTMGVLMVCVLASIPIKDRRGRTGWTKLVEIVCSRKTCLLITYVFAWTYAVDAVAGLWSARSIDFAPCTGNGTVLSGILEWRSKLDGVISREAAQSETNLDAIVSADNDIAGGEMEAARFSFESSASSEPQSSTLDTDESQVTSAAAVDSDATSDGNQMTENETAEAEERDMVANATTEDEAVTSEAEQGAGAVNGTIGTSDSDAKVVTGDSQITAETESNETEEHGSIAEKTSEATAEDEVVAPETAPVFEPLLAPHLVEQGIGSDDTGVLAEAQASPEPKEKGASSLVTDDIAPVNSAVETAAADVVTDATNDLEPRQLPESFETGEDSQMEPDVSEAHEVGAGSSAMVNMVSADVESSSPEVDANDLHDDIEKAKFVRDDELAKETERASEEMEAKDRYEYIEADSDIFDKAAIDGEIAAAQAERASLDTAKEADDDAARSVSGSASPDEEVTATGIESNQTNEEASGESVPVPRVSIVHEQAPLPETDGAHQPPKRKPPARFTPDEANGESGPAPQVVYEQVPLPDTGAADELPRRKPPARFTPEEANGESVPVPRVSIVYEQAPLPETDGAVQPPKRKTPARFTPDETSGESGPAPQVVYEQVPLPDTGAADELPRRKPPARSTPEEASGESVPVPRVSIAHEQAPLPETFGADQPPKRKLPARFTPEGANRESGPAPQVVYEQVPLPDTGAADKLPRRKPPARFTPPFLAKIMKESTLNNWSVRDTTDRLNGRALFEFHHSGVGHWVAPMADSNNDPTVNRALHSVALSVVAVVVTNTLRHCSAFLLGVDGSYKNQAMMDALSEVWISKFWS